ncbi:AIPR family protein [Pontiellaceae bacterium B1224]|nr:AIPR family protein [Pontiellaceae bacterium B1224]
MTIDEFYEDFTQEMLARSGAEENFTKSVFLDYMCTTLETEGVISGYDLTEHKITAKGSRHQAVDAWSYDPEFSCLTVILADYHTSDSLKNLTNTEIGKAFKRLRNFVESALDPTFAKALEDSDPVVSLAWLIRESQEEISSLKLILLSNAQLSSRVAELPSDNAGGFETIYEVWDLGRLFRCESSGKAREDIEISFENLEGGGLSCLPAYTGENSIQSYLLVMPGAVLAELYRDYGERLLEQNVRTFLQFRGKINKGIRNTIVNEPQMFFSYNNGLSATAEAVETNSSDNRLLKVKNLQVVNGGQTTASIFTASKKDDAKLDQVYVQIKLSVIDPSLVDEVVPRISEYSNTQNRVNAADFFSNHPFHLRIEEFSRRVWASSPDGGIQQTHWFYERARGQFANQQTHLTKAEKKKFLAQNPRNQMFTKTDLAKYVLSFDEAPHEVSLGAQKAFSGTPKTKGLVGRIAALWDKSGGKEFNEIWFKQAVAKAIFFREVDRLVFKMPWYAGYKANVVTYTLAKFSNMVGQIGFKIDFLEVWERQCLPDEILDQLGVISEVVNDIIQNPPEGVTSNSSEWAKKEYCWEKVREVEIEFSPDVEACLIDKNEAQQRKKDGKRGQVIEDSIHAQTYVFEKGAAHWELLREWNRVNRKLSPKELGILNTACSIPRKIPSDKQAVLLIKAENRAKEDGFFAG